MQQLHIAKFLQPSKQQQRQALLKDAATKGTQ
jgi:hypothetical protein